MPIRNATTTPEQLAKGAVIPAPNVEPVIVNATAADILPTPTPTAIANAIKNATPTPGQIAAGAPDVVPTVVIGGGEPEVVPEIHPEFGVKIETPLTYEQSSRVNRLMRAAGANMSPKTSTD